MNRTRPRRRLLGSLAAAAVLTAGLLGTTTATAPPASAAACTGTSGVTVVVDFTALGGSIQTGCAPGDPTSGLAALTGAGFTYAFHPRFPGMVCRINALPNPCNGAPATAYWSYWHAAHGGPWNYSTLGAGSYDPAPGDVEGWAFGAGSQPGITAP
ncbi:flagellar hook-length control protein FliK [Kitasatospora sp. NPDC093679]|uniref:flagellar hook-length control protein FliK n=1 Tax=Kitasatospora sp. NPDC093679 TaxID=3154983 RepID=UPI0034421454